MWYFSASFQSFSVVRNPLKKLMRLYPFWGASAMLSLQVGQ
jgi:hypothetical protein